MKLFAERRRTFADPRHAGGEGLVDLSDDLSPERLLEAYSFGIFPWPQEGLPTLWFSPEPRGVLEFDRLHVPRSLKKVMARATWTWSLNLAFDRVLRACATKARPGQPGTWITARIREAYVRFHRAGYAHSLEVWDGEDLVGGLYGVYVGGLFCGESMFFTRANASKFALLKLIEFLGDHGSRWMDIQMVTPVLEQLGGRYVTRTEFLARLDDCKRDAKPIVFTRPS